MAQSDVERGQEFRKCIECFLCQNTCHVIRDHEENKPAFAGPRFFIRYAELDMHPLDTLDRRKMAQESEGLGYCNITKCCTEVCPEGIHITDNGIIPLKERVVDTKYDPVFLGLRIGRRKDRRVVGPAGGSGPSPIKRPGGVTPGARVPAAPAAPAATATLVRAPASNGAKPAASAPAPASSTEKLKTVLPAVGAAAGIGFLAWALRRSRSTRK
jgi:hypothetical protein